MPQHFRRFRLPKMILLRDGMLQRFADHPTAVLIPAADLADAKSLNVIRFSYMFVVVHLFHLLASGSDVPEIVMSRWVLF
jgi:hypothetical protein